MKQRLIDILKDYTKENLNNKSLKELLIMYNLLFNRDYALEQERQEWE